MGALALVPSSDDSHYNQQEKNYKKATDEEVNNAKSEGQDANSVFSVY